MKYLTLFVCLIVLGYQTSEGQIFFEENFESGSLPSDWTVQSNATDGGWKVGPPAVLSSGYFEILENGSGNVVGTNDDFCNCNKRDEYLLTPEFDLSQYTAVAMSFESFFGDAFFQGAQEDATVEITKDGQNWVLLEDIHGHNSWDVHKYDISSFTGETAVQFRFKYSDAGGWLYGMAIDNFILEVPTDLEVELIELNSRDFGEVNTLVPIRGAVFNAGVQTITEMTFQYTIDGGNPITEELTGLDIPAFTYKTLELPNPWQPDAAGMYTVNVEIISVNGKMDSDPTNNSDEFTLEIYEKVEAPNLIDEILASIPDIQEIQGASVHLDKPMDLDFFPILGKDELWIVNERIENTGGSTLTISDATAETPTNFWHRVDGNAWHFMSLPTGIAFSDDNFNFATSTGVKDANHSNGTFTGPSLWSSDPAIYAQPSGGNGSHLDMLHGSPFCMGIAHETENTFWVYDNWNKDIVRYDFVDDHGPGNDDHSDAIVRRFRSIGINGDPGIPNHLILDKSTGWLYFVDNGNDRIMRLDINSGTGSTNIPLINEPLAEHSQITGFVVEEIINTGLDQPCGIEIIENRLLVSDYSNGDILVYDMDNGFEEIGKISTGESGITGIKIGPKGKIWYTNRLLNRLMTVDIGEPTSVRDQFRDIEISLSPNPASQFINLNLPKDENLDEIQVRILDLYGRVLVDLQEVTYNEEISIQDIPEGMYILEVRGSDILTTKSFVKSD